MLRHEWCIFIFEDIDVLLHGNHFKRKDDLKTVYCLYSQKQQLSWWQYYYCDYKCWRQLVIGLCLLQTVIKCWTLCYQIYTSYYWLALLSRSRRIQLNGSCPLDYLHWGCPLVCYVGHGGPHHTKAGLIRGLRPANKRRRYFVTTSLIGWAQA